MPLTPKRPRGSEPSPPWLRLIVAVLYGPVAAVYRLRYEGREHLPRTGGAIVVINHVSHADPIVVSRFLYDTGRAPRFLAKRGLFDVPVVGAALRGSGQIPVDRGTSVAAQSLDDAVAALRRGQVIVVYPEGTVTRDPDGWPMAGRSGAARLALQAPEIPVLPAAQWGAQQAIDVYNRRYRFWPRPVATVRLGPPLDLRRFREQVEHGVPAGSVLPAMTDHLMTCIREMVADLRGLPVPPGPLYRHTPVRRDRDVA